MWIVWALACGGPEPEDTAANPVDSDPLPDTDTDTDPDPGPGGTDPPGTTPGAAPIATVLGDCGGAFQVPPAYPNQLGEGDGLHEHVLTDPDAVCNDGTPAVLYVRAATDPAHAGDWVLHLQGGSDCVSYEDCAARYCGDGFYDASKMSSRWTPEAIAGFGIHTMNPASQFAGWNHVMFYYCSSDVWQGRAHSTMRSADGSSAYTLERRGHQILEAGLEALEAGGVASGDGAETLGSILDARAVLFTGTSVGSIGAQAHLDWLRARWPASIGLYGVFDAAVSPAPETVPPAVSDLVEEMTRERHALRVAADDTPMFGDESCLATVDPADEYVCFNSAQLPYGHVATPFLARMDHFDDPTGDIYVAAGATQLEFAAGVTASLDLMGAQDQADVYGPACGEHLGLESTTVFLEQAVTTALGPVTLHDAVLAGAAGVDVTVNDRGHDQSVCAP